MSIRRGWTQEEDTILKMLKDQREIKKWSSIARIMDFQFNICGRNGKQCRERYNNHLAEDIVEQKFTFEDQRLLEKLNSQLGNRWALISKAFKGRTANFLKNQLYSKLRKSIRKLNRYMKETKMKSIKPFKLNIVYQIVQSNDFKIFEKQRHSVSDLEFYSQLKSDLFRFAEQLLPIPNCSETKSIQHQSAIIQNIQNVEDDSIILMRKLLKFTKMYEDLNKKSKKSRRKYFCEDDLILNSLSNNKYENDFLWKNMEPIQEQYEPEQSNKSSIHSHPNQVYDSQRELLKKKGTSQTIPHETTSTNLRGLQESQLISERDHNEQMQIRMDNERSDRRWSFPRENSREWECSLTLNNYNQRFVQEMDMIENYTKSYRLLEQSQQCQFIDMQYEQHFRSCSCIDESLFQE